MTGNSGVLRVVARRSVRHLDVGNTRQPLRRGASGHHGDRRALDRGCPAEIVGATTSTRAARGDEPVGRITDLPDAGHVAGNRNGPQQRDHRRDAEVALESRMARPGPVDDVHLRSSATSSKPGAHRSRAVASVPSANASRPRQSTACSTRAVRRHNGQPPSMSTSNRSAATRSMVQVCEQPGPTSRTGVITGATGGHRPGIPVRLGTTRISPSRPP